MQPSPRRHQLKKLFQDVSITLYKRDDMTSIDSRRRDALRPNILVHNENKRGTGTMFPDSTSMPATEDVQKFIDNGHRSLERKGC